MHTYEFMPEQNKIWNMEKRYPLGDICNIGGYLHLEGKYNVSLLQKTMEIFAKTNCSLWTRLTEDDKIYLEEIKEYHMEVCDYRDLTEKETDDRINIFMCTPFDLYGGYLFEFKILILKDKTVVFEKFHHLIADGYSVVLCARIQEKIYQQLEQGETVFETDRRYIDGLAAQQSEQKQEKDRDNELENSRFVSLNRAVSCADAGIVTENKFDSNRIYEYCRKNRTSVEALFYGCMGIYLCKVYNCDSVAIGRNLLNRNRDNMTMVGLKADTKGFIVTPDWAVTVGQFFSGLKKELGEHARHTENKGYQGKIDIVVSYRPVRCLPAPSKGECREYMNSSVEVPVKLFINDNGKSIELQVKYQKEAYAGKEIKHFIRKMMFVMEQVLENSGESLESIKITDEEEQKNIQESGEGQEWNYSISLPERFMESVKRMNKKTALIYQDKKYSYGKIYEMVIILKQMIASCSGSDRNRIVGLCMKRTPWLPVAMYASWLSGYSFLPVSPMDSKERKSSIQKQCAVFITDEMIENYLVNEHEEYVSEHAIRTDIPAYYMFTSGTTGASKAVMISHSSLCCRLEWMEKQFRDGIEVILQKTRHTFDVSIWELILPWAFGKTMCMLEDGKEALPKDIEKTLIKNSVTIVHFVPSMFRYFLQYSMTHKMEYRDLKYIILSGEALDAELVKMAKEYFNNVEIYNLYGPTECTIDVSYYRCRGNEEAVPIGKPVYGTGLYILNEKGECLPPGKKGELAVTGELVGMGYLGIKEEEKTGFVNMKDKPSVRMYRTGDMAVLGEDGYFYYKGRMDSQIKIRGMRANLQEIESILNSRMRKVWNVIVYMNERLVDFYCGDITEEQVRKIATDALSYYCVPSEYVKMQEIPVGLHGKADRGKLCESYYSMTKNNRVEEKFSDNNEIRRREVLLLEVAKTCLNRGDLDVNSNLFDVGMDSLLVLEFISQCEQKGIHISYEQVYEKLCIKELAKQHYRMEKGLVYLNEKNGERILLFVPFAGGTPYHFKKIADKLSDSEITIAAVNMPFFLENTIEQIGNNIAGILNQRGYTEVYICGACVGSALVIKLVSMLRERTKGIILCEALPYTVRNHTGNFRTIWDVMPDRVLEKSLHLLRGKSFKVTSDMIKCFREDVRKSFEYLAKNEQIRPECQIILVYGQKDMLTKGFRYRYHNWKKWIKGSYKIYTYKEGKHFMTEDNPYVLVRVIKEILMK